MTCDRCLAMCVCMYVCVYVMSQGVDLCDTLAAAEPRTADKGTARQQVGPAATTAEGSMVRRNEEDQRKFTSMVKGMSQHVVLWYLRPGL